MHPSCEREDLDQPLDPDIRVSGRYPRHKVELVAGGESVSCCGVIDFRQQVDGRLLRMGGIAGVSTRAEYRDKGYARRVMTNALRWMRQAGFDSTMLYGIPNFYPKFGYAKAFPECTFSVAVRDTERIPRVGHSFVNFGPGHLHSVLRMYHAGNAERTGPTRRDARHWIPFRKGLKWGPKAVCKVALDARGRPCGYFVYDAHPLTAVVIEVGYATPAVFADMLRAAARLAWKERLEHVRLLLPEDHPFVQFCMPLGISRNTTYRKDGGAMIRLVNVRSALTKLAAPLARRLHGRGSITLRTNLDDARLTWAGGKLAVRPPAPAGCQVRLPQWALAQLIYGYQSPAALAAAGILRSSAAGLATLTYLFPPKPHFHYPVDKF
ncbi:MAG: GNAT family N-acetyltransferase [Kiritimatiellae bacterium]|nr:GNAT family N-acetyltransferase [Kiritimatiellia bacterium]